MDAPLRQYLGWERFPENLTEPEIAHFFSLSVEIRRTVQRHRRPLNRLGVALQIGFLLLTGQPAEAFLRRNAVPTHAFSEGDRLMARPAESRARCSIPWR
jgi:hypothetical protein